MSEVGMKQSLVVTFIYRMASITRQIHSEDKKRRWFLILHFFAGELGNKERKDTDIYIYFKEKDGSWTKPINLGDSVNFNFNKTVLSITPDGKYLFLSRYNEKDGLSSLHWISTKVIEPHRPIL